MIEIIPAIMPKDFNDLREKVSLVEGLVSFVQIDVMDGKFVGSVDWPCDESTQDFDKMKEGEIKLSDGTGISYEIDLMVDDPEDHIDPWIKAGAKRLIFHIESIKNKQDFFNKLPSGIEIGIAIDIATPNEDLYSWIDKIKLIQFMGIAKIGFQGEKFDDRVLNKISNLRQKYSDIIISVDGGVNLETALLLVEAGASRLVSGSAIFGSGDIPTAIENFKNL